MSVTRVFEWPHAPEEVREAVRSEFGRKFDHVAVCLTLPAVDWLNQAVCDHPDQDEYAGFVLLCGDTRKDPYGRRTRRHLPPKEERGWTPYDTS